MAREFAKKFYDSKAWKLCRKSFIADRIAIDGGMCEHCKDKLGYIVDHKEEITYENINNADVSLNHKNLQYLCLKCHNTKTFGTDKEIVREGLMFNSNGELIQSPHK
jgi:5-methylcytosine-specific restriction endonuclease McrA